MSFDDIFLILRLGILDKKRLLYHLLQTLLSAKTIKPLSLCFLINLPTACFTSIMLSGSTYLDHA